jgi:DNA mismatch repair protein MutL
MANPEIHFQLQSQGKVLHDYLRCDALFSRVAQVFGPETARSFASIDFEGGGTGVSGFLAPPDIQRTNSQSLFLYVNRRAVWDRLLQRAVLTAYEALIPRGKYPVVVLFLQIQPGQVDVNVHPAKREIRFRNPGEVISTVRTALLETLSAVRPKSYGFSHGGESGTFERRQPGTPAWAGENQASFTFAGRRREMGSAAFPNRDYHIVPPHEASLEPQPDRGKPAESPAGPPLQVEMNAAPLAWSGLNLIGQLADSFILLESPDGLVLIDQHAAHERIVFNRLSKKAATTAAQLLTRPAVVHFLPKEAVLLEALLPSLRDIGFEIESFGGTSFTVHAVPASLTGFEPDQILGDYLRFAEEEYPANESEIMLGLARAASCHGSIRAGRRLKTEEIKHLLGMLDSADVPFTCPHGRPLCYTLTYEQIYRFFKRS